MTIGLPDGLSESARQTYILERCIDQPIVVDGDGVIIKGHGRRKAAQALGLNAFPVTVRTDLTPEQMRLSRLADNRSSEGGWDWEPLAQELQTLESDLPDVDFDILGMTSDWLASLAPDRRPTVTLLSDDDATIAADIANIPPERYPLAVVLTAAQYADWQSLKQRAGVTSDTQMVVRLMEGA